MAALEMAVEAAESDAGRCECEDRPLSPAQAEWVRRQKTQREAAVALVRCLLEAGARVERWDLREGRGVELLFVEDDPSGSSSCLTVVANAQSPCGEQREATASLEPLASQPPPPLVTDVASPADALAHEVIVPETDVLAVAAEGAATPALVPLPFPTPGPPGRPVPRTPTPLSAPKARAKPVLHTERHIVDLNLATSEKLQENSANRPTTFPRSKSTFQPASARLVPILPRPAPHPEPRPPPACAPGPVLGPVPGPSPGPASSSSPAQMKPARLVPIAPRPTPHLESRPAPRPSPGPPPPCAPRPGPGSGPEPRSGPAPSSAPAQTGGSGVRLMQVVALGQWRPAAGPAAGPAVHPARSSADHTMGPAANVATDPAFPGTCPDTSSTTSPFCPASPATGPVGPAANPGPLTDPEPQGGADRPAKGVAKSFPSLSVIVRPQLRRDECPRSQHLRERSAIGHSVNTLLKDGRKLMEWLVQKKLVPPTQVLSGSFFEAVDDVSPGDVLRLVFQWACGTGATSLQEEVAARSRLGQRLRVVFRLLRAVCTAALRRDTAIGGAGLPVQVGIVSLGTVARHSSERTVKVEVLGVLDEARRRLRLLSVKPLQEGKKNCKARFAQILQPLSEWVDKWSQIVTDFSVDGDALRKMGFAHVLQKSPGDGSLISNAAIMTYLKTVIPDMFQQTLSVLNRPLIQQFLDELCWREQWGWRPCLAYFNILQHIATLTQEYAGGNLLSKLQEIAENPFRTWEENTMGEISISLSQPLRSVSSPDFPMRNTSRLRSSSQPPRPAKKPRWEERSSASITSEDPISASPGTPTLPAAPPPSPEQTEPDRALQMLGNTSLRPQPPTSPMDSAAELVKCRLHPHEEGAVGEPPSKACESMRLTPRSRKYITFSEKVEHMSCLECSNLMNRNHFMYRQKSCPTCAFRTFCRSAAVRHSASSHGHRQLRLGSGLRHRVKRPRRAGKVLQGRVAKPRLQPPPPASPSLPKQPLRTRMRGCCECGFKSNQGDVLALHLVCSSHTKIIILKPIEEYSNEG